MEKSIFSVTIKYVQNISVARLRRFKSDLDIFQEKRPIEPDLLQSDLYTPLPVSGDTLIWGFHILNSAVNAEKKELFCTLLPSLSPKEMLLLALKLEGRIGKYSWVEKEKILSFLNKYNHPLIPDELQMLIEDRKDPRFSQKILEYSRLCTVMKQLVDEKWIDLKTALHVQILPADALLHIRHEKRFSFSERRLFLTKLSEISRKQKMNPDEIYSLTKKTITAREPLQTIQRLRYPELSKLEDRFSDIKAHSLKGTGIELIAPPYFEGDFFTVQFTFNSSQNLKRKCRDLRNFQGYSDELFTLLQ